MSKKMKNTTQLSKKEMAWMVKQRNQVLWNEGYLNNLRDIYERPSRYFSGRNAMVEKVDGENRAYTIDRMKSDIDALGTALLSMGFKGKHFAMLAENSYEWMVCFFAVTCGVGVVAPLDKELPDETLSKLMDKADCEGVFFTKTFKRTVRDHLATHPDFKLAVSLYTEKDGDRYSSFDALVKKGRELVESGDRSFTDAKIEPDDLATIMFTSGTTGSNKGVMLSHKNFATNVDGILSTIPTEYTSFSLLPMNHAYELSCDIFTSIYMNACIYVNDSFKNVQKNLNEWKPEAMAAVPLVLEGFYYGILDAAEKKGMKDALMKLVAFSNKMRKKGIDLRPVLFSTIQHNFCDRKFPTLVSGGAPSRAEYVTGLGDFGFHIYNGYGLTEASPTVTLNLHADEDPTSAGFPFPKTQVHIDSPDKDGIGEIWIKGDNVTKGYYKDEEANKLSFTEDGWFKTGDYGRMSQDGELFVSGRKKNLIILENGENIFPEDLEFTVMDNIHYITQVVCFQAKKTIHGKRRDIIVVSVNIDENHFTGKSKEQIEEIVSKDISDLNKTLPSYKKIQDVDVVMEPFEINSTRKVIRQKVVDSYVERHKE